jgi:uncharacterized protein (TIGR00251 family)
MKDVEHLDICNTPDGAVLTVKAVAGSSRNRVAGVLGDALKVATSAPAEKGRANDAIAQTLAEALDVAPKAVSLTAGQTHPRKQFLIAGVDDRYIRNRLHTLT